MWINCICGLMEPNVKSSILMSTKKKYIHTLFIHPVFTGTLFICLHLLWLFFLCVFVYFGTHFINTWIQIEPNECKEPCKDDCLMWLLLLRLLLVPLPCTMCECVSFSFVCAALEHLFMFSIFARWHYVKAVSNKKYIYHLLEKLFQLIRLWNGLVKFP